MIRTGELLQQTSYNSQIHTDEWRSYAAYVRREAGNFCANCRRNDVPLQVHHLFYVPDRKLWEYELDDVIVLCASCHKAYHEQLNQFRKHVFRYLRPEHLRVLNGALLVGCCEHDPLEFVHAVAEMASSPGAITRFAYAWNGGKKTAGMRVNQ